MKDFIYIELEVTNSRNDNASYTGKIFTNDEDAKAWKDEKEKEADNWNYKTAGVVSHRFYSFSEFGFDQFLEIPISELRGVTVGQLMEFFNSQAK